MTQVHGPTSADAMRVAASVTGIDALHATRFATGTANFVFEVALASGPPVVTRFAGQGKRADVAGALELSRLLHPMGVPLPELLGHDADARFPWMLLERLPGRDLGDVIGYLDATRLDGIARRVASAQGIVALLPAACRFGYAVRAGDAPHASWEAFLEAGWRRSRDRISAAGLFGDGPAGEIRQLLVNLPPRPPGQPAVAFLHDTTTKNVIVGDDGSFSGIVDVDDLCWGDPRFAPALAMAAIRTFGGPPSYVDAWMRHAGLADDRTFRAYVAMHA